MQSFRISGDMGYVNALVKTISVQHGIEEGKVYTDGAGPPGSLEVPSFGQSVGSVAVSVVWDDRGLAADCSVAMSTLLGRQTVPRAETQGVRLAGNLARLAQC